MLSPVSFFSCSGFVSGSSSQVQTFFLKLCIYLCHCHSVIKLKVSFKKCLDLIIVWCGVVNSGSCPSKSAGVWCNLTLHLTEVALSSSFNANRMT